MFLLALTAVWCLVNTWLLTQAPLDSYPFQLFNLALAILVGLQGPLIVMSQNRQSLKDRARADTDFKVNLKNEVNIEILLRDPGEFRAELRGHAGHNDPPTTSPRGWQRRHDQAAHGAADPLRIPGGIVNYGKLAAFRGMP